VGSPAVVNGVIFRQLFDAPSSTYTFLVACPHTHEGILIDPVYEQVCGPAQHSTTQHADSAVQAPARTHTAALTRNHKCCCCSLQAERDLEVLDDLGVNLVVAANTHAHADHITGSGKLKVSAHTGGLSNTKVRPWHRH
jgi:glyoxylase-like metal-dependent hydrolase (beta-lactamase superfamily II)